MQIYTMRTTGSYIDIKGSAVIWRFQDTDTDFGTLQANELRHHLGEVLKNFPVQIILGKEHVEVRPEGVDKGAFVAKVLAWAERGKDNSKLSQGKAPPADVGMVDFVLLLEMNLMMSQCLKKSTPNTKSMDLCRGRPSNIKQRYGF